MITESKRRSFVKSITYRIAAIIVLGILSWIFTKSAFQTSAITIIFTILATIIYYFHERIWDKITWDRREQKNPNS